MKAMMTAMMTAAIKCRLFIFLPLACLSGWPPLGALQGTPGVMDLGGG